jgi:hypothetical protein
MLKPFGTLITLTILTITTFGQTIHHLGQVPAHADNVSVVVNPRNPLNLMVAVGGMLQYSFDGGQTWEKSALDDSCSHSVVIANVKGDAHFLTVKQTAGGKRGIFCRTSSDGGKIWSDATPITETLTNDQGMPWGIYDGKENLHVSWTAFDRSGSNDQNCQSHIMLSRSPNGKKWNEPIEISQTPGDCQNGKMAVAGSLPIIGVDGKMFVTWTHGDMIMLDRSFDGSLWLSNDIAFMQQKNGRTIDVPEVGATNGKALIVSDRSKSDHRGLLYLIYADQRLSKSNAEIFFSRSLNYGDLWTSPEKINKAGGKHDQFLPWLAIDQYTGYLYVLYYEMTDEGMIDVNLSWSNDAGLTFKTTKLNKEPFKLAPTGTPEYINVSAHKGTVCAAWLQSENDNKQSLHLATLKHEDLLKNP